MLKKLFIFILVAAFIGSNVYFFSTAFTLFNFLMFLVIVYILFFTKRRYDLNFLLVLGIISLFIIMGFIYLVLFLGILSRLRILSILPIFLTSSL